MSLVLDTASLELAFQGRPDIQTAIQRAATSPSYVELFNQISLYICGLPSVSATDSEPAQKKRRLDDNLADRTAAADKGKPVTVSDNLAEKSAAAAKEVSILEISDISFLAPQRKKYTLCFTETYLYATAAGTQNPVSGTCYAWRDIAYVFRLPVPEKAQKQDAYVLFPKASNLPLSRASTGTQTSEPIVFVVNSTAPKPNTIAGSATAAASAVSDTYRSLFDWAISQRLKACRSGVAIIQSDPKVFASNQKQSYLPNEKAVHITAFRGAKDGYLFFLPIGILWGFKKPLMFIPFERISAVSYTNVLQRTYNLMLEIDLSEKDGGDEVDIQELEFSMLDQEDFATIDEYVKRHGLQDRSMAEQRKAQRLNVNVVKDENGQVIGSAEAGELQKAGLGGREANGGAGADAWGGDDDEDEDEEDYDPGSEGESEGSGTSSEEDEDGEGGEQDEDEDGEEDDEEL